MQDMTGTRKELAQAGDGRLRATHVSTRVILTEALLLVVLGTAGAMGWMPERDGRFAAAFSEDERFGRMFNYLGANFIRAFGPDEWHERWAEIALSELRRVGCTVAADDDGLVIEPSCGPDTLPAYRTRPGTKSLRLRLRAS